MTQLDYAKDMIVDINNQSEMVENVAASSEELSSSTDEISSFVQESYNATNESIEISHHSMNNINEFFSKIEETMSKTNEIKETMGSVNYQAKRIDEMVVIIKGVADRTNLLALNASIEAARAGEHGKGFSVVANEIKKLAESTKEQVEFIREVVTSLTTEISRTTTAVDEAMDSFSSSKEYMDNAVESIDGINEVLSSIGNSFMEISANIEEQTAATQEMSANLLDINEKTRVLKDNTIMTGESFYKISKLVDEARILAYNESECIDQNTQIEICISDHLMWKWRVYNMLLGFETIAEEAVGTHHTCRLGKWIDNKEFTNPNGEEIVAKLESPHARLHNLAKDAIRSYNNNDLRSAENSLVLMDAASKEVVQYLNKLQKVY